MIYNLLDTAELPADFSTITDFLGGNIQQNEKLYQAIVGALFLYHGNHVQFEVSIDKSSRVDMYVPGLNLFAEVKVGLAWKQAEITAQINRYQTIIGNDYTVIGTHPSGRFGLLSLSELNDWILDNCDDLASKAYSTFLFDQDELDIDEPKQDTEERLAWVKQEISNLESAKLKNHNKPTKTGKPRNGDPRVALARQKLKQMGISWAEYATVADPLTLVETPTVPNATINEEQVAKQVSIENSLFKDSYTSLSSTSCTSVAYLSTNPKSHQRPKPKAKTKSGVNRIEQLDKEIMTLDLLRIELEEELS